MSKLSELKDRILNLIYPSEIKCIFCTEELNQNGNNSTCENCLDTLPFITNPCARCGSQMQANQQGVCLKCKKRNYYFKEAKSVFEYTGAPLLVVQNLKYNGCKYLVKPMVKYILDEYAKWNVFADIVTCIPMFEVKEKQRGYNQSKLLAEEFAKESNIPFYELCTKVIDTVSQTELGVQERIKNLLDSFAFQKEYKKIIKNKTILIVDDTITTGATTSEISKVLLKAGAKECYAISFCHTSLKELSVEATNN